MLQYSKLAVDNAIKVMEEEGKNVRVAALEYRLQGTTLQDQGTDVHGKRHGRPTHLHPDEKHLLVEHIKLLADWGFHMT
jgi:biotin operon repressor